MASRAPNLLSLSGLLAFVAGLAAGCGSSERGERSGSGNAGGSGEPAAGGSGAGGGGDAGGDAGSGASQGGAMTGGSDGRGGMNATGGVAGSSSPTGGASTIGGTAGVAGDAGAGGSGTPTDCTWVIDDSLSGAIPTVGIVEWSNGLAGLTEARIEFTLNDAGAGILNVGSGGPISIEGATHRALLLGLKPAKTYTYRIVARAGSSVCASPERTLTTGAKPAEAPSVTRTVMNASAQARGFIVTTTGNAEEGHAVYVIDADGDVVWWAPAPARSSRARMGWEGTDMWMLAVNDESAGGELRRVSMDGMSTEPNVQGLEQMHHDFTVLPGGVIVGLSWLAPNGGTAQPSDLIERSANGAIRTLIRLDETAYAPYSPPDSDYLATSIDYQRESDTFTVSDNLSGSILKLSRQGELLWQFGSPECTGAVAPKCWSGFLGRASGHHFMPNGQLLAFYNVGLESFTRSLVYEHAVSDTDTAFTSHVSWEYSATDVVSYELGDVQRLPNGNTLIVYSDAGDIREVTPAGEVVQLIGASTFGYGSFRETLYGPPLR